MFQVTEQDVAKHLERTLCEFVGDGSLCEKCNQPISGDEPVHFFSDGGYEPRDGTYVCKACAVKIIKFEE